MPGTAALAASIAAAELRLRDALLAGAATAELHAELAALRTDHERALAEQAEAAAKPRSGERGARRPGLPEAAAGHAPAAAERLSGLKAALAPPSSTALADRRPGPTRPLPP